MSIYRTPAYRLREAIYLLRDALAELQVLGHPDDIVLTLPFEAGKRFEAWYFRTPRDYADVWANIERRASEPADIPMRSVLIDGVKIQWPTRFVAPGGATTSEPMAQLLEDLIAAPISQLESQR